MNSHKNRIFSKRSTLLLLPLPFLIFFLKACSRSQIPFFNSFLLDDERSIFAPFSSQSLAEKLNPPLPENVINNGDIWTIPTLSSSTGLILKQFNPFETFSLGGGYKYEDVDLDGFNQIRTVNDKKLLKITGRTSSDSSKDKKTLSTFHISKDDFEKTDLKDKGDLNLVVHFDFKASNEDLKTYPISTIIPFRDLLHNSQINHPIISVRETIYSFEEVKYSFEIKKNETSKSLDISLVEEKKSIAQGKSGDLESKPFSYTGSFSVNSIFVLYSENPPVDFGYFFENKNTLETLNNFSNHYKPRLVFLDKWNIDSSDSSQKTQNEKSYIFDRKTSDWWKSVCFDPYKVGGWIDEDLEKKSSPVVKAKPPATTKSKTKIQQQLETGDEFKPEYEVKPKQTKQYYWSQITTKKNDKKYVPSTDYTTPSPCEGMDDETKEMYKFFYGKTLLHEPWHHKISSTPTKEFEDWKNGTSSIQKPDSESSYPFNKIIQSSFRAWGNGYSGEHTVKWLGIWNKHFEESLVTEHTFSLKIPNEKIKSQLVHHSSLEDSKSGSKKLNEQEEISSLVQVNFPISFTIYDPITNYLRKRKLSLFMDLDLRGIFNQSSFSKSLLSIDLGKSERILGKDYLGYSISSRTHGSKNFGIDGILEFLSGLEISQSKDLLINIIAKTKGFVNTKNPTCDLRHRLYKFALYSWDFLDNNVLEHGKSCSNQSGWAYRRHNHIPSYLIITLEQEPTLSSFYLDRRVSGVYSTQLANFNRTKREAENQKKEIRTLKEFESNLDSREIKKSISLNKTNNGEVFFDHLSAYDKTTKDKYDLKDTVSNPGWFSTSYYHYLYYYAQRQNTNSIFVNSKNLRTLSLFLEGSSHLSSNFFRSNHFNTVMTLCSSDKPSENLDYTNDCGDGRKYKTIEKDKTFSDLSEKNGRQTLSIPWTSISPKTQSSDPFKFEFRTIIHKENSKKHGKEDSRSFDNVKEKYEKLFKDDSETPDYKQKQNYPDFSLIIVWYSLEMWWDNSKSILHYRTKLRPISMVSEPLDNRNVGLAIGASGSAGFQINKMEFLYDNKKD